MQVVLNHNSPATTSVYGFQVPTKYAAWLELLVIHVLVPRSSFMGHMCGILAGQSVMLPRLCELALPSNGCLLFMSTGYIFVLTPGVQILLTRASEWLESVGRTLIASEREPGADHHRDDPPPSRSSPRSSSRFETDEMLARRLQEEEFRQRDTHAEPTDRGDEPQHISASELRRRRLARFGGAS